MVNRVDKVQDDLEETRKWEALDKQLEAGLSADGSEFRPLDAESVIRKARAKWAKHAD